MTATPNFVDRNINAEHLRAEIQLLNRYLLREVERRTQNTQQQQLDQLQGLILNEREILSILSDGGRNTEPPTDGEDVESTGSTGEFLPEPEPWASSELNRLSEFFNLSRIEKQCLVLCLAAEIDPDYGKVYAYLQDDVTQKHPSVGLALRLFCSDEEDRIAKRAMFSASAPLLKYRLLYLSEGAERVSALPQLTMKIDDRVAAFVLQTPQIDPLLADWVRLVPGQRSDNAAPDEIHERTARLVENCLCSVESPSPLLIHLYGKAGSGRRSVALQASARIGLPLLIADANQMSRTDATEALWRLAREALFLPATILIEHFDELRETSRQRELAVLIEALQRFAPVTFFAGNTPWTLKNAQQLFLSIECRIPDSRTRAQLWKKYLADKSHNVSENELIELAGKFNFTEGQISETVGFALHRAHWETQPPLPLSAKHLSQASQSVATPSLEGLARRIKSCHSWDDIVLPDGHIQQLKEIATHVRSAQLVFETWGFANKFSYGTGVTALFEGTSGTGKTMAAEILGRELELGLYKIDLSYVVSKYIGETEKNLNRIFSEAEESNAILFFDEADALFGKRSEVKDAHDRYANIETAFLLQRMEEYSGIVILATNMKHNMDEAFVRRMRFIVHFPAPDEQYRLRLWQQMFPSDAPLAADVDFQWLAKKLRVTGGHIKNISLRAAFLATERQGIITMDCLIDASRREIEKLGKISGMSDLLKKNSSGLMPLAEVA